MGGHIMYIKLLQIFFFKINLYRVKYRKKLATRIWFEILFLFYSQVDKT